MRFRPFPTLMGVLVVLVMDVEVIVPEGHMDMLDLDRIARRPEPDREHRRHDRQNAQYRKAVPNPATAPNHPASG